MTNRVLAPFTLRLGDGVVAGALDRFPRPYGPTAKERA
jgi:hypothetical protein